MWGMFLEPWVTNGGGRGGGVSLPWIRHCRRNLTSPSNFYEAVSMSLFSTPNGHNELSQRKGEFPFSLLANWQWLFWQANHSTYLNPDTYVGAQNKDPSPFHSTDLTRSLVPSVALATLFYTGPDVPKWLLYNNNSYPNLDPGFNTHRIVPLSNLKLWKLALTFSPRGVNKYVLWPRTYRYGLSEWCPFTGRKRRNWVLSLFHLTFQIIGPSRGPLYSRTKRCATFCLSADLAK